MRPEQSSKLNHAIEILQSKKSCKWIFHQVMFIIQHDRWYNTEDRATLLQLCEQYPHFTPKQLHRIRDPPKLTDRYNDSMVESDSDHDGDY